LGSFTGNGTFAC
jgi:hypothetical protein